MNKRLLCALALLLVAASQLGGCVVAAVGGAATAGNVAHDRRGAGTVINDQKIELSVTDALYGKPEFESTDRIKVVSVNGVVLLAGETGSEEKKLLAGEIAGRVKDVRKVVNELVVTDIVAGVGTRTRDSLLTAKVKAALTHIDIEGFDPTRVNVTTASGRVYLQGLVTEAEGRAAAEEASLVGGVEQVVKVFEYIPPEPRGIRLEGNLGSGLDQDEN